MKAHVNVKIKLCFNFAFMPLQRFAFIKANAKKDKIKIKNPDES